MRYLQNRELRAADARTKKARQQEARERKAKKQAGREAAAEAERRAVRSLPNAAKIAEKIRAQAEVKPSRSRR